MRAARVFISCGQGNEKEISVGKTVCEYFRSRGFEPYYADKIHSPEALTEHIFSFLNNSEYFVFIDFKRGRIPKSKGKHRGSLFVNQEIAIAAFLKISGLGFYEKNIKREGILNYIITNAFSFLSIDEIMLKLEEETRGWDNTSVNELTLSYNPEHDSKNYTITGHPRNALSDWWHIEVINGHKAKHAFSCLGFLSKVKNVDTEEEIKVPSIELLWSGYGVSSMNIWANDRREFDAFFIIHEENMIRFQGRPSTTSNPRYNLPQLRNGRYILEYTIISSNFETVSKEFLLDFRTTRENIKFSEYTGIIED